MNHQCTGYTTSTGMPRRRFLNQFGMGLGAVALSDLLKSELAADDPKEGAMAQLDHPAKAKRVIFFIVLEDSPILHLGPERVTENRLGQNF